MPSKKFSKPTPGTATDVARVRSRRAYFDCRFGQLHVRTAFPTTGGFDEGVPLLCLHPKKVSSRVFARFLPRMAEDRSVYAPDLPGCGESDPGPQGGAAEAAVAIVDFAADLRLRQIDVLGFRFGAEVALQLAASKPELVRRLVLVAAAAENAVPELPHESLVMRLEAGAQHEGHATPNQRGRTRVVQLVDYTEDLFDAAPKTLSVQIGEFLRATAR